MDRSDTSRRRFLAVCGTALAAGTAGCSDSLFGGDGGVEDGEDTTPVDPDTPVPPDGGGDPNGGDEADNYEQFDQSDDGAYADVYGSTIDSVAQIQVYTSAPNPAGGTGFVYSDGYVVTNQHVVEGAENVFLRFRESEWLSAEVIGTDVYSDLAVLSVSDLPDSATPLALAESDPAVGSEVVAIGNPFRYSGSVSAGIVSGVNRTLPAPNDFSIPDAIQTDAAVNPGNSGGPLVTLEGDVAGVINSGGGDNIGFAISAPLTRRVIPALLEDGEYDHSYMGVRLQTVGPLLAEANDVDDRVGVYIAVVRDGGPSDGVLRGSTGETSVAGQSGVETGGDVVVALDDTPIPTREALASFLALQTSPGDTIDVTVLRDGEEQTVELTLGSRPTPTR